MSNQNYSAQVGFLQHRDGDVIKARYGVLGRLGGGNFGSVYRVRDSVVGNILACKEMHVLNDPSSRRDERALALDLFKREALNLATLRHPHIPAAYFEQEDGNWHVCPICGLDFLGAVQCPVHGAELLQISQRHYLMMDFIDGATLEELAIEYSKQRGRPLPETDCIEWMVQIASALRSLHKLGIVHRDIKPDNITIRASDKTAMLLDFGLTKKIEEAGHYGTLRLSGTGRFGTLGYAPPDAQEQQNPEARSDIYALGMTLLRLLTGRDPQEEDDLRDLQTHAPRYFNSRISPEIERVLRRATAPKKAERYADVEEFLRDLNELRPHESSTRSAPPFTFADGFRARTPQDLARAVEDYPRESLNYLWNGMFADWLRQSGFAAPAAAQNVVVRFEKEPQRALETFRRSLYKSQSRDVLPQLQLEPPILNFGGVPSGAKRSLEIRLKNVGAGFSWGQILIEDAADDKDLRNFQVALPGLSAPLEWNGNEVTLQIALDATQAPLGRQSGALLFQSDEQTVRVPISYTIEALELVLSPSRLDFGNVALDQCATLKLSTRKSRDNDGEARGARSGARAVVPVEPDKRRLTLRNSRFRTARRRRSARPGGDVTLRFCSAEFGDNFGFRGRKWGGDEKRGANFRHRGGRVQRRDCGVADALGNLGFRRLAAVAVAHQIAPFL